MGLTKLRGERKIQRAKDAKTFTGMFDRGEIYEEFMENERKKPCASEFEMREIQKRIENISDDDSLEKRCEDAELLRDLYMRNGKEEEAKELNEKIKTAKQAMKEQEKPKLDWSQPTPEMVEDAKKYGLDLSDPLVIEELQRLEREGLSELPLDEEATAENASSDSARTGTAFDVPSPEVDLSVSIPWARYYGLFAAIFAAWRLADAGVFRWLIVLIWRRLLRLLLLFGLGSSAEDTDDETGSLFAVAYRKIAVLLGGDSEDGEL